MAKGGKDEHRMLFDIRGRRKNVVKVVYGILALLMGLSLLLVVGPAPLADIFGLEDSTESGAQQFEEQAERIEVKLVKDPEDPTLLANLTRAQINAGNAQVEVDPSTGQSSVSVEARQAFEKASSTWSEYLKATNEPSAGVALLAVPALVLLAETSSTGREGEANILAAAEGQQIVADQRPSLNSFFTLALYRAFSGDYAAAEEAKEEASKLATSKSQREQIDTQYDETVERAKEFEKQQAEVKKLEKEAPGQTGGGTAGAGNPFDAGGSLSE